MDHSALAYSVKEACEVSSIGRTTIYGAIKRGDLKTHKVGRRTLITAQNLKSWLDSCSTEHATSNSNGGHLE